MRTPTEAEMQAMKDRLEIRGSSLYWKHQKKHRPVDLTVPAGSATKKGYMRISLASDQGKKHWMAHRIAYFLHHGVWPTQILDHKDQDKQNNDPENLRLATEALNKQNTKVRSNNVLGVKGAQKQGRLYKAYLTANNIKHQKLFPTLEEAIAHRKYLEEKYHPFASSQQTVA